MTTITTIHSSYINIINTIYYNQGTSIIILHKDSYKINIDRGVRQEDTVSLKLFNAVLKGIFRRLDWDRKGINIHSDDLSHLLFVDDIVLITNNAEKLEEMLNDLNKESAILGLRINMKKTSHVQQLQIKVNNDILETINRFVFLFQRILPSMT